MRLLSIRHAAPVCRAFMLWEMCAGPPYFMAVARKRGMIAAKNIMGEKAGMG